MHDILKETTLFTFRNLRASPTKIALMYVQTQPPPIVHLPFYVRFRFGKRRSLIRTMSIGILAYTDCTQQAKRPLFEKTEIKI